MKHVEYIHPIKAKMKELVVVLATGREIIEATGKYTPQVSPLSLQILAASLVEDTWVDILESGDILPWSVIALSQRIVETANDGTVSSEKVAVD